MSWHHTGWMTPVPKENRPEPQEIPETGQYELHIPGYDLPVVLQWRVGYQPKPFPKPGNLSPENYASVSGYPVSWGQGKVANDDVTCCRLMYNGQPLTLNLTVDKFNRSSLIAPVVVRPM